jgi:5-methylcytosine-specific restriction endonuclease McrA
VTNTFLFARDGYRCAYCGRHEKDLGKREGLNRDHIIPQSKGGPNTWANCVTACSRCNSLKADRSLAEFTEATGLRLRVKPREPGLVELKWTVRKLSPIQRHYIEQFYGADTLEALGGNEEVS